MAELDDGFARLANEILEEAAKRKFNSTQSSIILFIIRHTYGFQRKAHSMSVKFIADGTDVNPDQIKRELKRLIDWKLVRVFEEPTYTTSRIIGMNKNCDEWNAPTHRGSNGTEGTTQSPGDKNAPTEGTNSPPGGGDCLAPQIKIGFKDNFKDIIYTVFEHWNSKKIVVHRELTQATKSAINARLKKNSVEDLTGAIDNYHAIIVSPDHYWTYKWTLKDFMKPANLERFLTANNPFSNFRSKGNVIEAFDNESYLAGLEDE